jgi:sialate O-acetylesterase
MNSRLLLTILTTAASLLAEHSTQAEVKLAALFSDHLVLQSDKAVPVWGWADPGEEVTVSIAGQSKSAKAGADGKWMVKLDALKAAEEPTTLTAKGSNTVTAKDVLIGEVWLGSGQSNMAMVVSKAKDFEQEKAASDLPKVRMFVVSGTFAKEAAKDCIGSWVVCSPETVGGFSATAFFFGREIHKQLKVPVGLINSSVGGTPIEAWISPEAQLASAELKPLFAAIEKENAAADPAAIKAAYEKQLAEWTESVKKAKSEGKPLPRRPQDPFALRAMKNSVGGLFNGKIAPLIPFGLRGVLWYQGEANSVPIKAPYYQHHLPLLVTDWRARWGEDLPFAWVQLPNFTSRGDGWCLVREAMLKTLKLPKTGMAITLDIGDPKNIHPTNKQEVGRRLAQWALGTVYDKKVETSGPLPAKHEVKDGAIVVSFTHAEGLTAKGGELKDFVIAGEDKQWQPAKARIEEGKVIVSADAVPKPLAVRYAWKDTPEATLFNGAGLPATQFRTDDWPIVFPDLEAIRRKALDEKAAKNAARAKAMAAKAKAKGAPAPKAGTEAKADARPESNPKP